MAGRKPAKKKAAKKKAAKKKVVRATKRAVARRPSSPLAGLSLESLKSVRVLVTPLTLFEYLRSRGFILNPFNVERSVLVRFNDSGRLNYPTAKRSYGHEVSFENKGKLDRTLELSYWPFVGTATTILVPAGTTVGPFALNPDDEYVGPVIATGTPPFGGGSGPGDPGFDVDG